MEVPFSSFLKAFTSRRVGIVLDDLAPKTRAVLVSPAIDMTADRVNDLISISGGLLFVALTPARVGAFVLSSMTRPHTKVGDSSDSDTLQLCVSVEAREGVTTGISTSDRATTIRILGEETPQPRKLVKPGHLFPVEVKDGGVLVRSSLPESALDIVRASGGTDAAVFIDVLTPEGEYLTRDQIYSLSEEKDIPITTLSDLVTYRLEHETLVYRFAEARLPTRGAGEVKSIIYKSKIHSGEHIALIKGEVDPITPTLTRVQTEFTFGDVFGGSNPPTRDQIVRSLNAIGERGAGVLLYLRRPARGQLEEQVRSWESKFHEKPAYMMREYGLGAQILRDLGVRKIDLLTNSKKSLVGLTTFGIEIVSQKALN